jgi:hypothetical protein
MRWEGWTGVESTTIGFGWRRNKESIYRVGLEWPIDTVSHMLYQQRVDVKKIRKIKGICLRFDGLQQLKLISKSFAALVYRVAKGL